MRLFRAGLAGLFATGADLLVLSTLVTLAHWTPRAANVPALFVGGVVNFIGNRGYAFRARQGNVAKQAVGFSAVELVALGLNGVLYDAVLRLFPGWGRLFWLVRLATTHLVFLCWSFPLWNRVFRPDARSPVRS
jgi:putative flippase GtrA